jgi:hypothetical protein
VTPTTFLIETCRQRKHVCQRRLPVRPGPRGPVLREHVQLYVQVLDASSLRCAGCQMPWVLLSAAVRCTLPNTVSPYRLAPFDTATPAAACVLGGSVGIIDSCAIYCPANLVTGT